MQRPFALQHGPTRPPTTGTYLAIAPQRILEHERQLGVTKVDVAVQAGVAALAFDKGLDHVAESG